MLEAACVSTPAHTDYVRITYVGSGGESVASAENSLSQPANVLTTVKSPPAAPGVTGYNVYAVRNNGGSGTGETLQNASPIAIGVDFRQPESGWTTSGAVAPTTATSVTRASHNVTAPVAPSLISGSCGAIVPAHSNYVRVTYVTADGETVGSGEAVLEQTTDARIIVHSPAPVAGILGYNVYAAKDDRGRIAGEALQNRTPIAFGTDFEESQSGWTHVGRSAPTANTAFVKRSAPVAITQLGGYVEATAPNGPREAFILPENDAPANTEVVAGATMGLPAGAPPPQSDVNAGPSKAVVLETIDLTSSEDVTFHGCPTFKFTLPHNVNVVPGPYVVELYDGATNELLATMPAFSRQELSFLSDYTTPFKVLHNRQYFAELIGSSPHTLAVSTAKASTAVRLPTLAGISASLVLPPTATDKNGALFNVVASTLPPVGLPVLRAPSSALPLYYASIVVMGTAAPSGTAQLTVTLPPGATVGDRSYRLAAYDDGAASSGWHGDIEPSKISGDVLSFTLNLPGFLGFRQYGVALYSFDSKSKRLGNEANVSEALAKSTPDVIVVGDSLSKLSILPPSTAGCIAGWAPLPQCQYSIDPTLNWPGFLAKLTGKKVRNLSQLGAATMIDEFFGESMLNLQVPQIPAKTRVVIVDWGSADLGIGGGAPATSAHAALMTKAILARAPSAQIIYLGLRCDSSSCANPGVDAWNDADKQLANRYGAFIDLREIAPDGINSAFPDGGHPSLEAARAIANKVAAVLRGLKLTRQ